MFKTLQNDLSETKFSRFLTKNTLKTLQKGPFFEHLPFKILGKDTRCPNDFVIIRRFLAVPGDDETGPKTPFGSVHVADKKR